VGVPVLAAGLASDAKSIGVQAGYEKALKGLLVALAGADLVTGGAGLLYGANLLSLPQIVIDLEIARMIRACLRGIEVPEDGLMIESIMRVPFGGHFLAERETRRWSRKASFPVIADRGSYEQWALSGLGEGERAAREVERLLASEDGLAPIVSTEVEMELNEIVVRHSAGDVRR
jgi:trimethylamine--corrinoid protein Co-methyltransferase